VRFGSVGGGGRYDGWSRASWASRCRDRFSIGVSRLQAALTALGKLDANRRQARCWSRCLARECAGVQKLAAELRKPASAPSFISATPNTHRAAAQICRQTRQPLRCHSGADEKAKAKCNCAT